MTPSDQPGGRTPQEPSGRGDQQRFDEARLAKVLAEELEQRASRLTAALAAGDDEELQILLEELGAIVGPDDPALLERLTELEQTLLAGEIETSAIVEKIETLLQMCHRPKSEGGDDSVAS